MRSSEFAVEVVTVVGVAAAAAAAAVIVVVVVVVTFVVTVVAANALVVALFVVVGTARTTDKRRFRVWKTKNNIAARAQCLRDGDDGVTARCVARTPAAPFDDVGVAVGVGALTKLNGTDHAFRAAAEFVDEPPRAVDAVEAVDDVDAVDAVDAVDELFVAIADVLDENAADKPLVVVVDVEVAVDETGEAFALLPGTTRISHELNEMNE